MITAKDRRGRSPKPFDPTALSRALRVGTPPAYLTREGRVRLIGEAANRLLQLNGEAERFVGGALLAWLQDGGACGSLEREYFDVVEPKSHHTASWIWRRFIRMKEIQGEAADDPSHSPSLERE